MRKTTALTFWSLFLSVSYPQTASGADPEVYSRIDPAPRPETTLPVDASDEAVERAAVGICGTTRKCSDDFRFARDLVARANANREVPAKSVAKAIADNTDDKGLVNWPWVLRMIPDIDPSGNAAIYRNLRRNTTTCTTTSSRRSATTTCRSY